VVRVSGGAEQLRRPNVSQPSKHAPHVAANAEANRNLASLSSASFILVTLCIRTSALGIEAARVCRAALF
jgi:hypothetical protein